MGFNSKIELGFAAIVDPYKRFDDAHDTYWPM